MMTTFFYRLYEYYSNSKYEKFGAELNNIPTKFLRKIILYKFIDFIIENHYYNSVFTKEELFNIIATNGEVKI